MNVEKVKSALKAVFAWVNTESFAVIALAAGMWGYQYKANHPEAPYTSLLEFIVALCAGFFWSRRKKQALNINAPLGLKIEAGPAGDEPNREEK